MTETRPERYRAPIEYGVLQLPWNVARGIAGLLLALANLYGLVGLGITGQWIGVLTGAIVVADAAYRLRNGDSALMPLIVDTTAIGIALTMAGPAPATMTAGIAYVLIASMLLLALPVAAAAIAYAFGWIAISMVVTATLDDKAFFGTSSNVDTSITFDMITAMAIVGIIAVLLVGAVRALLDAQDRNRRALEVERRAVEVKNEFVSMVSHELRTPLTGIAGFTDTLRESWQHLPPDEVDEFLTIMRDETEHLSDLVEDILVIPRLDAGYLRLAPESLDVVAATTNVAELILRGRRDFEVSFSGPVMVSADPVRLKQILRNLLGNALKYGGDQVLFEGRHYGSGEYLVVISDNGLGVADEDRERIFEHFEQLSKGDARLEQGVGLGLPIARKLARAMGGELWYEPRFPVGSHFCFTLPLANANRSATDDKSPLAESLG